MENKQAAHFTPVFCFLIRSWHNQRSAFCSLFHASFHQHALHSQPFPVPVSRLLDMSNTPQSYLHYPELPDDASSWSSAFDPPKNLPTTRKDKSAKSTKKKNGSKKKAKRGKAKKSKRKQKDLRPLCHY